MTKKTNSAAVTTEPKRPALVPQPHGGALSTGGMPGNRGGPGRPPSQLRRDDEARHILTAYDRLYRTISRQ